MADRFQGYSGGLTASATKAEAVTPHDSNNLTDTSRALWVGAAGNVACVFADGSVVTLVGVPAGTMLPVRVTRVNLTNTTATSIVALS